jgi:hypothetical protein
MGLPHANAPGRGGWPGALSRSLWAWPDRRGGHDCCLGVVSSSSLNYQSKARRKLLQINDLG